MPITPIISDTTIPPMYPSLKAAKSVDEFLEHRALYHEEFFGLLFAVCAKAPPGNNDVTHADQQFAEGVGRSSERDVIYCGDDIFSHMFNSIRYLLKLPRNGDQNL